MISKENSLLFALDSKGKSNPVRTRICRENPILFLKDFE